MYVCKLLDAGMGTVQQIKTDKVVAFESADAWLTYALLGASESNKQNFDWVTIRIFRARMGSSQPFTHQDLDDDPQVHDHHGLLFLLLSHV